MDGRMLGGGQVEMEGVGGSLPPRFVCARVCACVPSQEDAAAQKVRESLPESL